MKVSRTIGALCAFCALYVLSYSLLYDRNGRSYDPSTNRMHRGSFKLFLVRFPGDLTIYGPRHTVIDTLYFPLVVCHDFLDSQRRASAAPSIP